MCARVALSVLCVLCGASFVLVGCDTPPTIDLNTDAGPTGEGEGEAAVVSIDDVVSAWDAVACGVFACVSQTRVTDEICALSTTAQGEPFGTIRFAAATIAADRGAFDVERGAACLEVIARMEGFADDCFGAFAVSFDNAFGIDFAASCGALVHGLVPENDACVDDSECVDGTFCRLTAETFEGCERTCRPRLAVNDSCVEQRTDCSDDAYCDGDVCVTRNLTVTGGQCFGHEECVSQRCFDFVCQEKSGLNGECVAEGDCQFGQFCRPLPPSTGLLGVCQDHSGVGEECGFAIACNGNQVCPGFAIKNSGSNQNGVCQAVPADVGAACTPIAAGFDAGDTGCYADLLCNAVSSTCEAAPPTGAACTAEGACGFNAWCDNGICAQKRRRGQSAPTAAACEDPTYYSSFAEVCGDPDNNRCLAAF